MSSLDELKEARKQKIQLLTEAGKNPYPSETTRTHTLKEAHSQFEQITGEITLAGRIMSVRGQGALIFFTLFDGTDSFQGLCKKDSMDGAVFSLFADTTDIGDFIEVTGTLFVTNRGEKTIQVSHWNMLTKSLRPMPEKWHGLVDEEERFRKRYLDILTDPDTRNLLEKRSKFFASIRSFLITRGFLEVDTPVLENTAGGAEARPFLTHYNAYDTDVYLRISPELWLKRLLVAGFPKIFEIGRIFRNEGADAEHLQDYTQIEFYQAYASYTEGMDFVRDLYRHIAQETFGTQQFSIRGFDVDLSMDWEVYDYVATIEKKTGINVLSVELSELEDKLEELGVPYDKKGFNKNRAVDTLWKYCRKQIAGPGFLVNVPVFLEPLAKRKADNPELVERFQVILAGSELGKGFSELNDPLDQEGRFVEQMKLREAGDEEAQMADADFIEALEYGMPPTFGFGLSERLFAFLAGKPLRETQFFPFMRPKHDEK